MTHQQREPTFVGQAQQTRAGVWNLEKRPNVFRWITPSCTGGSQLGGSTPCYYGVPGYDWWPEWQNSWDHPDPGTNMAFFAFRMTTHGTWETKGVLNAANAANGTVAFTVPTADPNLVPHGGGGSHQLTPVRITLDGTSRSVVTGTAFVDKDTGEVTVSWFGGPAMFHIKVVADDAVGIAGNGKFIFECTRDMHTWKLRDVEMYVTTVSSAGNPTFQVRNVNTGNDMLSTPVSVDQGEFVSKDATTPVVINQGNWQVSWGDRIAIDLDIVGTGARGHGIILSFFP